MQKEQMKAIIGGIFGTGTYTVWDEEGQAHVKKEKFNIRLYKDLWYSGAIKKLKGNRLGVFLTIAIHADNNGEGWPTQNTIASMLGIGRDAVINALKHLEKDGFIERERTRHKGKFDNTVYKIKFAPDLKDKSEGPDPESESKRKKTERPRKYHVGKTDTEKPTRKNRHGKADTKEDLLSKNDPTFKDDPSSSLIGSIGQLKNPPSQKSNDSQYDDDFQYKTFRQEFVSRGGDDIKLHREHYPKFKQLLKNHGFLQLLQMVDTYIKRYVQTGKHVTPQVVWFLSDGWKSCTINNNTRDKREQKRKINPIPAALAKQLQTQKEAAATIIEENDDDWDEINQQLAEWNQMKSISHTSF